MLSRVSRCNDSSTALCNPDAKAVRSSQRIPQSRYFVKHEGWHQRDAAGTYRRPVFDPERRSRTACIFTLKPIEQPMQISGRKLRSRRLRSFRLKFISMALESTRNIPARRVYFLTSESNRQA
jgi:hypothetical protein